MNRYQKFTIIGFRFVAVLLVLQAISVIVATKFLAGSTVMLGLVSSAPNLVGGIVLYLLSVPLSRIVTLGVRDD